MGIRVRKSVNAQWRRVEKLRDSGLVRRVLRKCLTKTGGG